jgi:hypothetical protein
MTSPVDKTARVATPRSTPTSLVLAGSGAPPTAATRDAQWRPPASRMTVTRWHSGQSGRLRQPNVSGLRDPHTTGGGTQAVAGQPDRGPVVLAGPEPGVPDLAALACTGQGVEPVPARRPRVPAGRHQRHRRDPAQPLPGRGGLGEGDDRGLHLRVAGFLPGSVRVLAGWRRVVEHHRGVARRPGQHRAPARGGTSTVTATSQQPLNVTAPTDNPTALFPRRPTTGGYPGGEGPGLRRRKYAVSGVLDSPVKAVVTELVEPAVRSIAFGWLALARAWGCWCQGWCSGWPTTRASSWS